MLECPPRQGINAEGGAPSNINATPSASSIQTRTRTRIVRPPERYRQTVAFMAQPWDSMWEIQDYEIQTAMADPIAFAASSNPDIMYLHEALKAPDRDEFLKAMQQEVKDHEERGHWELVSKSDIPEGTIILPAVWAMRRKRRITTNEVYKWKARLNVHGGKQVKNVHYWETYSPVVKWSSIRLFLMIAAIKKWHTRQIDFVLAYPHADIETDMYMEIPRGFESQGPKGTQCLKLKKNLYGQKQAGQIWNKFLHKGLTDIGFEQSTVDECVYYRGTSILLCYVDDTILIDPSNKEIDKIIQQLRDHKFDVQDEGQIEDFLGVRIRHNRNGTIEMSQPHLIQQILQDLNLEPPIGAINKTSKYTPKSLDTPATSTVILERDPEGESHNESWHY